MAYSNYRSNKNAILETAPEIFSPYRRAYRLTPATRLA
ncbi:hypothetical protein HCH_04694 [Hahella chejuensis KCTC 2396]|uniref:Uncharacterized protein n=1 Tax=Hahella chejuensis (strain KCTC 2396) TaxID=349521 RepID=Q2SD82_HAHCH|nr:hypothetical protein HCH_04694 [Hahella chejuensis KCTC 2396]